jgi:putative membrane protein
MTTQNFLYSAWSWQPGLILFCVAALGIYCATPRLRQSGKIGFLLAGLLILLVTFASPIEALAKNYLFSAHMLQHLLLQLVIPPLILLSLPSLSGAASSKSGFAKPLGWLMKRPLLAWLAGLGAMWIWHAPMLCNASVANPLVHQVQTVSLLALGAVFWWPILSPRLSQRLSPLVGVIYLFTACLGCTVLGIIITFAPVGVCSVYVHPTDPLGMLPLIRNNWGMTPAADQQLGGLLMWVPACLIYLSGIMGLLARSYRAPENEEMRMPKPSLNPGPGLIGRAKKVTGEI